MRVKVLAAVVIDEPTQRISAIWRGKIDIAVLEKKGPRFGQGVVAL
jgi:hypothetical protein